MMAVLPSNPDMNALLSTTAQAFRQILRQQLPVAGVAATLPALARLSPQLGVADAVALGFWPTQADRSGALELASGDAKQPFGLLGLNLSPAAHHVALSWSPADAGMQIWIDGVLMNLPQVNGRAALVIRPGRWCDDRFFGQPLALEEHPLQDWASEPGSGTQFALWVWDAVRSQALLFQPGPSEAWPSPWMQADAQGAVQVFADRRVADAVPARTLSPMTGPSA